ncbi:MAG: helix-turn-helix transcriptional regulator [Oscillospiraceae bacterium]|nr:helix-turn-helix domain-containing protein [Oscillospiraceae bacterium]MBQ2862438.1 helix-turn-helix transcriptional regulator [Oscillospiraceae bacterium]MBQ2998421.1 helix-turn-helix transcriptional regulator [Oscillospiraceae bacterium]
MKSNIGENIKYYRRQKNFTQEQLAEAMGVSVGAVSKWESASSVPELSLIMELADFFEISVDALLGYKVRDNSAKETAERIDSLQDEKKYDEAIAEAEKALKKFPNNFEIVYQSALTFFMKGLEKCDDSSLEKALELYNTALTLCNGPNEKGIGPSKIYRDIAETYDCLGKHREAVELLKKYNDNGMYDDLIGYIGSTFYSDDPKCIEYLSDSLVNSLTSLFRTAFGFANYYQKNDKNCQRALDALLVCKNINEMFRIPGKTSYLDKSNVIILVACANFSAELGDIEKAKEYLLEAKNTAEYFDANPNYSAENIRFYKKEKPGSAGDNFGETAIEGIENTIKYNNGGSPALVGIWQEMKQNG